MQAAVAGSRSVLGPSQLVAPETPFADARRHVVEENGTRSIHAALFGAPLDLTESFRAGAAGGPAAVRGLSASLESYSPAVGRDMQDLIVLDLGDLALGHTGMDDALALIADGMEAAADLGRVGVMIGGEHTASLGAYRGIKRLYPNAMLVQLDAHLDMREEYEGQPITHASWLFHAGTEYGFHDIVQLGVRSGAREEWPRAREWTAHSAEDLLLPAAVMSRLAGRPIYLTVDIDVLDPAAAPGTGCPEPGGPPFRELGRSLLAMAGLHVVGLDVVEVFPALDPSGITAAAAAKIIRDCILMFGAGEPTAGVTV